LPQPGARSCCGSASAAPRACRGHRGGRLTWLAVTFAREPHDQRGWLKLFLFSNFYLLLLFGGMVAERLVWRLF